MPDPIAPPVARRATEAVELVCQALSDGDLDAALAQYENPAQLQTRARPAPGASPRDSLHELMDLRLPVSLTIQEILQVSGLTVVICERRISGLGPDCEPIRLRGYGFAAVRPRPDGAWRIAIDSWCLEAIPDEAAAELPPEPPEVPLGPAADAVRGEGPGRAASTS